MSRDVLLSIRNLVVEFRVPGGILRAVDGVDLDIYRGEVFALVGESGCGKTVLAHAILRLVAPNGYIKSGKIIFENKDVLSMSEEELRRYRWEDVAIIFQGALNAFNPVIKIVEHMVDTVLAHKRMSRDEIVQLASKLLETVQLDPARVLHSYSFQLSGGMRQRTVAAMSLLLMPKLLILDEPISALDMLTQCYFINMLKKLHKETGITMLFITHDIPSISGLADRIGVMYLGNIVEVGSVEEVLLNPLHPYTKALLNSIPTIRGTRKVKPVPGSTPNPLNPPPGCKFHPRCPYALDVCKRERPPLIDVGGGHSVACYLFKRKER